MQCHQDSFVSYCFLSFRTGVTCIDKFLYIGSHLLPSGVSSYMLYVILLTHFLEFLSCVGCPIISLNTAGENHAGIQHS